MHKPSTLSVKNKKTKTKTFETTFSKVSDFKNTKVPTTPE